jgi:hypothetical protein
MHVLNVGRHTNETIIFYLFDPKLYISINFNLFNYFKKKIGNTKYGMILWYMMAALVFDHLTSKSVLKHSTE